MTKFLETLKSELNLSSEIIAKFNEEEMTELIHFSKLTQENLRNDFGLKLGPANAILAYVESLTPQKVNSSLPVSIRLETESDEEKFEKLVNKFNSGDTSVIEDLKKFTNKVVFPNKKIDLAATKAMMGSKTLVKDIWKGLPVVLTSSLDKSWIYYHPREKNILQDGIDPNTGINWPELGDELLCLIAFAERANLLKNKDDEKVFEEFSSKTSKTYLVAKTKWDAGDFEISDWISDVKIKSKDLNQTKETKPVQKVSSSSGNSIAEFHKLASSMFSPDEFKRFCYYNTENVNSQVNWNGSPSTVMFDATNTLNQYGYLNSLDFWSRLLEERSRRRFDISSVSKMFDVNI
jgi:hypothetical protein